MEDNPLARFAGVVRGYLGWVDSAEHDFMALRTLLLSLLLTVPELEELDRAGDDVEYPRLESDVWITKLNQIEVPFSHYHKHYEPLNLEEGEPSIGMVHDDLADIYADLWQGIQAYEAGDWANAAWIWWHGFLSHWGHHASDLVPVIDDYVRKSRGFA